jgi:hypothetical protein
MKIPQAFSFYILVALGIMSVYCGKIDLVSVFKDTVWPSVHYQIGFGNSSLNLKIFNLLYPKHACHGQTKR